MLIFLLLSWTGKRFPEGEYIAKYYFSFFYLKCATKLLAGLVSRVKSFPYCTKLYLWQSLHIFLSYSFTNYIKQGPRSVYPIDRELEVI